MKQDSTEHTIASRDPFGLPLLLVCATGLIVVWLADISAHASTARMTFWSPTHVLLYGFGAIGLPASVRLALRAPGTRSDPAVFGADYWLIVTGCLLLMGAAVLDHRWHAIEPPQIAWLTPPHFLVAAAILIVQIGLWLSGRRFDARAAERPLTLPLLQPHAAGMILVWLATMAVEYVGRPNLWHGSEFYMVSGALFPVVIVAAARSSSLRWSASIAAGIYTGTILLAMWLLQAMPAQYSPGAANPLTHMMPPPFPLLLIVPAILTDLALSQLQGADGWIREIGLAALMGVIFVGSLLAVHWPFAEFLLSEAARNPLFAADQWPVHAPSGDWRYQYWNLDGGTRYFAQRMLAATVTAAISALLGLRLGRWQRPVGFAPADS